MAVTHRADAFQGAKRGRTVAEEKEGPKRDTTCVLSKIKSSAFDVNANLFVEEKGGMEGESKKFDFWGMRGISKLLRKVYWKGVNKVGCFVNLSSRYLPVAALYITVITIPRCQNMIIRYLRRDICKRITISRKHLSMKTRIPVESVGLGGFFGR